MNASGIKISSRCLSLLTDPIFLVHQVPTSVNYFEGSILTLCFINMLITVMSALSNTLVIRTVIKTFSIRTPSNILIAGLATTDLGVGLMAQIPYTIAQIADLKQNAKVFCAASEVFNFTMWNFGMASFYILCAITVDRFLAIRLHLRYRQVVTSKLCVVLVVCIHSFTIISGVVRLFIYGSAFYPFATTLYGVPTLINAALAVNIARMVHKHTKQISNAQSTTSINITTYKKSLSAIIYLTLAFIVCYTPYFATMSASFALEPSPEMKLIRSVGTALLMFNGVLNPWIYFWRIEELRHAALRAFLNCTVVRIIRNRYSTNTEE